MNRTSAAFVLLAIALPPFAQNASAQKAKSISPVVTQVNDRRSASFGQLMLSLDLPGIKTTEVAASRVVVTAATDDLGATLVDAEATPTMEQNMRGTMDFSGEEVPAASVNVTLKNPDRGATSLKSVQGELELFMPSKDPNSTAEIRNFLASGNKPVSHKALKANGIEIALVSSAQIDAMKKKSADAKRKEYVEYGYEGEGLEEAVKNWTDSLFQISEGDVLISVKDPQKRIQDVSFVDAHGETQRVMMDDEEGLTKLSTWGGAIQKDWTMRVQMRTPKNVVKYTFALENIPLP